MRVMTYNIRNSGANDGPNRWELRRDLWVNIVRKFDPDLLGVQEVLADQYDHLKEQFPDYTPAGVAREDGGRSGEWALILYRRDRFDPIENGDFWLSQSPTVAGSRSWDAACCRLCTWVKLRDKQTGRDLIHANVHLDHVGEIARRESATLLVSEFQRIANAQTAIILTGDFNSTEIDEPYAILARSGLLDSYRAAHPIRTDDESSYHEFGEPGIGMRIDWILHSPQLRATQSTIDRTRGTDGRFASDHDPVTAIFEWVDEK
jgi:endonuclease/exonuclease/phosphatase family metal-dependent hydrolase